MTQGEKVFYFGSNNLFFELSRAVNYLRYFNTESASLVVSLFGGDTHEIYKDISNILINIGEKNFTEDSREEFTLHLCSLKKVQNQWYQIFLLRKVVGEEEYGDFLNDQLFQKVKREFSELCH